MPLILCHVADAVLISIAFQSSSVPAYFTFAVHSPEPSSVPNTYSDQKAPIPTDVILLGIDTFASLGQFAKAEVPIVLTPSSIITVWRLLQWLKAPNQTPVLISLTFPGIVILVRLSQC